MGTVRLHRAMWKMMVSKLHFFLGIIFSILIGILVIFYAIPYWWFQARVIGKILSFAKVPYELFTLAKPINLIEGIPVYYYPSGPTFQIPVHYQSVPAFAALAICLLLLIAIILIYRMNIIPLPVKVIFIILAFLTGVSLLYTAFISPIPPHPLCRVIIDWQFSGVIILFLIGVIFTLTVFPLPGSLLTKSFWLFSTLVFSMIWNTVRISLVAATFYHLGSLPFLLIHYLMGVYVDFIYIVAFYSLVVSYLARRGISEVGWE